MDHKTAHTLISIMGIEYADIAAELGKGVRTVAGWMRGENETLPFYFEEWLNARWDEFRAEIKNFILDAAAYDTVVIGRSAPDDVPDGEFQAMRRAQIIACETVDKSWVDGK
ncbi:hypothetical protein [Arcanobacterium buesumense]|uniref:Uncharacterized protein n=1 Tax=Arcanobacterium buesumense TaxID=2722751 RepID=A0A6H2ELP8_9ACTO|nr:hypothetical protein [Arcanobacterium buesumense]QJC21993.1 hypothetical protein HC352_05415 [Arcanobacterium buesumense]